jgi:hypothetical protein
MTVRIAKMAGDAIVTRINTGRVIIGGIIAGIICFIGDGIVHGVLLNKEWAAVVATLGRSNAGRLGQADFGYFAIYDLLKGLLAVWIYAAALPRFGAGIGTALLAAFTVWLLVIPVPTLGLLPMAFFSARFAVLWSVYGLFPILAGTLIGAWCYREAKAVPPSFKSDQ